MFTNSLDWFVDGEKFCIAVSSLIFIVSAAFNSVRACIWLVGRILPHCVQCVLMVSTEKCNNARFLCFTFLF